MTETFLLMKHRDTETQRPPIPASLNELSGAIVNAAYKVHKNLGPGLLESIYETCLAYELELLGHRVKRQLPLPVYYGDLELDAGYRIDLLIDDFVIIELKAVEAILPVHKQQVLTYLKLANLRLGLLINFNVTLIKDGITRIVS